ncbi:hypothetical protein PMAYCL1PPCAC_25872, partial [Pristionchus mayeri]
KFPKKSLWRAEEYIPRYCLFTKTAFPSTISTAYERFSPFETEKSISSTALTSWEVVGTTQRID